MAAQNEMLRALHAKSCSINGAFQRFQSEMSALFRDLLQSDLDANQKSIYESKIKKLFNEYSFDINRLETEYFTKCESLINGKSIKSSTVSSNQLNQLNHSNRSKQINRSDQITSKPDPDPNHNTTKSTNKPNHVIPHNTVTPVQDAEKYENGKTNGNQEHQCTKCHRSFELWHRFAVHIRNVHNGYPYSCDHADCNRKFKYQRELRQHQNSVHHRKNGDRCSSSDFADDESEDSDLEMHGINEMDNVVDTEWQCDCGKRFKSERGLQYHIREVHGGKPLKCKFCDKLFAYKRELKVHLRSEHSMETQSNGTTTSSNSTVQSWKEVDESNETSTSSSQSGSDDDLEGFQCTECGKKLSSLRSLREHEMLHQEERPFPCHLCDSGFVAKERLRHHWIHSHDYGPYECALCNRRFIRKCELVAHQKEGCDEVSGCDVVSEGDVVSECDVVSENEDVVMSTEDKMEETESVPLQCGVRSIVNHRL